MSGNVNVNAQSVGVSEIGQRPTIEIEDDQANNGN